MRRIKWTEDFLVLEADAPTEVGLRALASSKTPWVVIRRRDAPHSYALTRKELLKLLNRRLAQHGLAVKPKPLLKLPKSLLLPPLGDLLDLHEDHESPPTKTREGLPLPVPRTQTSGQRLPSMDRYLHVSPKRKPLAIGVPWFAKEYSQSEASFSGLPSPVARPAPTDTVSELRRAQPPGPSAPVEQIEDEGTSPVRYPSIDSDRVPSPGGELVLTVDLKRREDEQTKSPGIRFRDLPANWRELDLAVVVRCPELEIENEGRGVVKIRRNADSVPAQFHCRVKEGIEAAATVGVIADFSHATRFCGSALRVLQLGVDPNTEKPERETKGVVVAEPSADAPDMSVYISALDKDRPGLLGWQVATSRFDGLPASLSGEINLGKECGAAAADLFGKFATLTRGQHRPRIEGFGSELWGLAPEMFRQVYWALWDHYHKPLRIQFISDDPHMPWELMRPARADDSEVHLPLALKHSVARWIKRYDGYMRNRLPGGSIYTIAPKYKSAIRELPRAQVESQSLVDQFDAKPQGGTHQAVLDLLERQPAEQVGILHFAGHGKFAPLVASQSEISLEDAPLAASEVSRPEVSLGRACRTLVFFNACEIGAGGTVFGQVGGWADAFLARYFGGFIAPLWSVDDQDAGEVARELLDGIVRRRLPIGEVLRAIREKHGDQSPTFFSYLYYGDVTARFHS